MKKTNFYILMLLLLTSCSDFLDDYSQDLVVTKSVSDFDEILLGSAYLPSVEIKQLRSGGVAWWLNILDDDINTPRRSVATSGLNGEMDQSYYGYTTWQLEVGRNYSGSRIVADDATWKQLYERINVTNIILDEIDTKPINNEQDRLMALRIKGEAHFLRGQFYLTLVNLYANAYKPGAAEQTLGVPLKLTSFVEHNKELGNQFERAPVSEVYKQIVSDLDLAIDYLTQSPQKNPRYRASKEASLLLLSRVYLYMQEWEKAKETANSLLNLPIAMMNYISLEQSGLAIDNQNPEILFSQGALNIQTAFSAEPGDFCISADLYNSYLDTDYRKRIFFKKINQSDSVSLNRKYRQELHRSAYSDLFMLRSVEAYLNIAEACAMLGENTEASNWLNKLKSNRIAGYLNPIYTAENIVAEVREERRRELCLEGHRWFDLRRYAANITAPFSKTIQRVFVVYNWNGKNEFLSSEVYELLPNDPAYTFSIPKSVLEFDRTMPDNPREKRNLTRTLNN